jgi:hypothetical protein
LRDDFDNYNPSALPQGMQVADSGQIMSDANVSNTNSDSNKDQALSYNTVAGGQNLSSWSINWQLAQPSPSGGIIVQEVEGQASVSDGTQTISTPYHYWEAWVVPPGGTGPLPSANSSSDDTFVDNNAGRANITGSDSGTTTAIFYEGMKLPQVFNSDNKSIYSGALPSTTVNPNLPASAGTKPMVRTWSINY